MEARDRGRGGDVKLEHFRRSEDDNKKKRKWISGAWKKKRTSSLK